MAQTRPYSPPYKATNYGMIVLIHDYPFKHQHAYGVRQSGKRWLLDDGDVYCERDLIREYKCEFSERSRSLQATDAKAIMNALQRRVTKDWIKKFRVLVQHIKKDLSISSGWRKIMREAAQAQLDDLKEQLRKGKKHAHTTTP